MMRVSGNHTDEGYLNHTLAYFNTTDFQVNFYDYEFYDYGLDEKKNF